MSKLAIILTPEDCAAGILRHLTTEHAHKVMQGFFLMHAHAAYSQRPGETRKTVLRVSSGEEHPGYTQWLEETFRGNISRQTAYHYRVAAENCGISLNMTEAQALAAAEAKLSGVKKLSDLYKALPEGDPGPPPAKQPPAMKPEQLWLDFGHELATQFAPQSKALRELPRLPLERIEELERYLRAAHAQVAEILTAKKKAHK